MTLTDLARQRLHNQRLALPGFGTPADVVRWFGAVQAQDLPAALYGVGLRMAAAMEQEVEQAIADRTIVRTWPMRGTIHLVPAEDARWMVKLLAPRQNVKYAAMRRKMGLTDGMFAHAGEVLAGALAGGQRLTRKEVYARLAAAGIIAESDPGGLQILGYWAQEGLICLGPRQGKQPTFVLLEEWIPGSRRLEGEEALAELATRYFASHGPASLQDFAWWTGLSVREAKVGLEAARSQLVTETIEGKTYWGGKDVAPAPHSGPRAYLLPAYDEFTVAYRDRRAFVDPAIAKDAGHGIGPIMLVDGRMVGSWKRTLQKDSVTVHLQPFAPLDDEQHAAFLGAAERYAAFLGLPAVVDS